VGRRCSAGTAPRRAIVCSRHHAADPAALLVRADSGLWKAADLRGSAIASRRMPRFARAARDVAEGRITRPRPRSSNCTRAISRCSRARWTRQESTVTDVMDEFTYAAFRRVFLLPANSAWMFSTGDCLFTTEEELAKHPGPGRRHSPALS